MGGSQEANTVSKYEPPEWTIPKWQEAVDRAYDISNVYGSGKDLSWQGGFASPLVQEQIDAIGGLRGMAMPTFMNQEKSWYQDAAKNNTLMNALAGSEGGMQNPYGGATNPYLEQMIGATRQNMTDAYGRGTAAQTDAAAARQGAYGGSAYNELTSANNKAFGEALGSMESGMRNDQYNRAAQLQENVFGRQMQGLGMTPSLQAGDVNLMQALLGGGEMSRGLDQQELEGQIGRHYQNVQQPLMAMDILFNALTRAGGGAGTTSSQMMGPGFSPVQAGLGGLGLLGGMMG